MKYDKDARHHCTIPKILNLKEWFEEKLGDVCKLHDEGYVLRSGKWKSDSLMYRAMWKRGLWYLIPPTFLMFNTIGFWYYYT